MHCGDPQIVGTLIEAGFDAYAIDLRRAGGTTLNTTGISSQRADGEPGEGGR